MLSTEITANLFEKKIGTLKLFTVDDFQCFKLKYQKIKKSMNEKSISSIAFHEAFNNYY